MKRDRNKIDYIGFGETAEYKSDWCPSNVCKVRMRLEPNGDLNCQECGRTVSKEQQQQQQQQVKISLKHDNNPGAPIIISQKDKNDKRKAKFDMPNNSLTDEDLDDLRNMGYRL
ncbi:MAG: hypothetical protein DLM72_08685 [Candidatus Nitrosopolaris wilkensis]|nr:MAG: hypothetical protein DLM72_08685 [Candidatus Nitrosopolaris wilkensis]